MLIEATHFLRGALPRGGSPLYQFDGGWAYAQSQALLAAYPTPDLQGTFGLAAEQVDAALKRFPKEPDISSNDDGHLVLKAGRLRTTLVPHFIDPPEADVSNIEWSPVPAGLIEALRLIAPFLPKEGTWQRGVRLYGNTATALNQRAAIEVDVPDLDADEALLSDEFVQYLIGIDTPPTEMAHANGSAYFRWPNGAWTKAQLLNFEWPASADKVMAIGGNDAPITINDQWREAFKDAAALAKENQVQILPAGFTGKAGSMNVDVDYETGVQAPSKWAIDVLEPMFKIATHWNPDCEIAARFYGKGLRGVVSKIR